MHSQHESGGAPKQYNVSVLCTTPHAIRCTSKSCHTMLGTTKFYQSCTARVALHFNIATPSAYWPLCTIPHSKSKSAHCCNWLAIGLVGGVGKKTWDKMAEACGLSTFQNMLCVVHTCMQSHMCPHMQTCSHYTCVCVHVHLSFLPACNLNVCYWYIRYYIHWAQHPLRMQCMNKKNYTRSGATKNWYLQCKTWPQSCNNNKTIGARVLPTLTKAPTC